MKGILDSIRKIMWTDKGLNGDAQRIEQLAWMLFFKIFSDKDKELEIMDGNYVSPIPEELHWDAWAGNDEGITGDELQVIVADENGVCITEILPLKCFSNINPYFF